MSQEPSEQEREVELNHEHKHERLPARDACRDDGQHGSRSGAEARDRAGNCGDLVGTDRAAPTKRGQESAVEPECPTALPELTGFTHTEVHELHSGPIPHPAILGLYGEIDSTLPGRIMDMAERDQDAELKDRHELVMAEAFAIRLGAFIGPLLVIGFSVAAVILFMNEKSTEAITSVTAAVAAYLTPHIIERSKKTSEKRERVREIESQGNDSGEEPQDGGEV